MIRRFVILGATGDLASRYLLPALARLHQVGGLSDELSIVGAAQDDWGPGAFCDHIRARLERHGADILASSRQVVVSRLEYRRADVTDPAELAKVLGGVRVPLVAYLALPPSVYAATVRTLGAVGLAEGSRVVVEKPFGEDLASAQALNRLLHGPLPETAVFRMDHLLGKQTVQSILGLRFANRVFEPLWNRNHIARVDIDQVRVRERLRELGGHAHDPLGR